MMSYGLRRAVDPFHEEPLPRAFYHPSSQRNVDGKDKKNHLSPERVKNQAKKSTKLTPEEEAFLCGSYKYQKSYKAFAKEQAEIGQEEEDGLSRFNESWPGSERPSSPSGCFSAHDEAGNFSSLMREEIKKSTQSRGSISTLFSSRGESTSPVSTIDNIKGRLNFDDFLKPEKTISSESGSEVKASEHASTLSKYIDRFRTGTPKSREERQRDSTTSKKDFWWLDSTCSPSTPPSSSTPREDEEPKISSTKTRSRIRTMTNVRDKHEDHSFTLTKKNLKSSGLADRLSQPNPWDFDEHTRHLQEKAEQLLEKTESSLSSADPAVSTDGLGQSSPDTTSIMSEIPYLPGFVHRRLNEKPGGTLRPTRKEDDILYQWRLKRKMELAKERVYSGMTRPVVQERFNSMKNRLIGAGVCNKLADDDLVNSKLAEFRQRLVSGNVVPGSSNFTPAPTKNSEDMTTSVQQGMIPIASPHISGSQDGVCQQRSDHKIQPHLHLDCDILPHGDRHPIETSRIKQTRRTNKLYENNVYQRSSHREVGVQYSMDHGEYCGSCGMDRVMSRSKEEAIQTDLPPDPRDKSVPVNDKNELCPVNFMPHQLETEEHLPGNTDYVGRSALDKSRGSVPNRLEHPTPHHSSELPSYRVGESISHDSGESPLARLNGENADSTYLDSESKRMKATKKNENDHKYVEEMIPEKDPGADGGITSKSKKDSHRKDSDFESRQSLTEVSDVDEGHRNCNDVPPIEGPHSNKKNGVPEKVNRHKEKPFGDVSRSSVKTRKSHHKTRSTKLSVQHSERSVEPGSKCRDLNDKREHIPEPRDHSSPCRPLSDTIGQVVRNHLLSSWSAESDTSLRSSVNTLPRSTLAASPELPVGEQIPDVDASRSAETGLVNEIKIGNQTIPLSDGEEFADDEFLQTLRERRQCFLNKLAQLNSR